MMKIGFFHKDIKQLFQAVGFELEKFVAGLRQMSSL